MANSAGLLLFTLIPTLLKGLPAFPVASLLQVVGHKGADGGLSGFIFMVIITETFAVLGFRRVHECFPIRPCVHLADAAVGLPAANGSG